MLYVLLARPKVQVHANLGRLIRHTDWAVILFLPFDDRTHAGEKMFLVISTIGKSLLPFPGFTCRSSPTKVLDLIPAKANSWPKDGGMDAARLVLEQQLRLAAIATPRCHAQPSLQFPTRSSFLPHAAKLALHDPSPNGWICFLFKPSTTR